MNNKIRYYLPNLPQSWILTIALTFGGSILAAIINFLIGAYFPPLAVYAQLLTYPVIFVPPLLIIMHELRRLRPGQQLPAIKIDNPHFGTLGAYLTIILLLPLVFSINIVSEPLTHWMGMPDFLKEFLEQIRANRISSFISIVIFAPLLEELFCRGILLRGLLSHIKPINAILWSSLMFAVMHLNPWQAIPAFLLGVLMGWIYWKTHSIWVVVFIHFINNGTSYLITILLPDLPLESGFIDIIPAEFYPAVYGAALLFTATVILLMHKSYDKPISTEVQTYS
jgi:membrane protease YdiL (CAAX protease family)